MRLHDKPLPKFEVSSRFDEYGQGAFIDADVPEMEETGDEKQAGSTFEQRVSAVITCVGAQNALREVLYKTLKHCESARDFSEVEDFIAHQDEFIYSHIIQTPFTLIQMLINAGGLEKTALDAQGCVVGEVSASCAANDREALADTAGEDAEADEDADAVASYELRTTPEGLQAAALLAPERRFASQMAQHPHRADTFYALLDFCQEPRTFPQIQDFFATTPNLARDVIAHHHKLSPDYYIDKLDKAGALVWRGAWVSTDSGKRILDVHKADAASAPACAGADDFACVVDAASQ